LYPEKFLPLKVLSYAKQQKVQQEEEDITDRPFSHTRIFSSFSGTFGNMKMS
jgi:hypothetical protein